MDTAAFLKQAITTPEGWFELLVGPPSGTGWHQEWFHWPEQLDQIVARAQGAAKQDNVYFTAHLYSAKSSTKSNALPSRTIQCDLDEAIVPVLNAPSILVETSPGRHQGFWIMREHMEPELLEGLSRRLTYSIPDADRSGWSLGHKMRLPGTFNYKYPSGPKVVKVITSTLQPLKDLRLSNVEATTISDASLDFWTPEPLVDTGPRKLWTSVKPKLPAKVARQYDKAQEGGEGRSGALWALILALFRVGLSRDQVFWLAKESANNKFKDQRYHGDLDLSKDILRAERSLADVDSSGTDIKTKVLDARRLPGLGSEKRAYIAALVRDHMQQRGSFVATTGGQEWYVREDLGRPIILSRANDYLNALLETRYGLNSSEVEHRYAVGYLMSTTRERGRPGVVAALTHYDAEQKTLLLHTGRKDVMVLDATSTSMVSNGNLGVVFPWRLNEEPFTPKLDTKLSFRVLFEDCFNNLIEMKPEHAEALLHAWMIFLLLRDAATARPLLTLLGQPGSGKSTLFRRIYAFLYGGSKGLNSVTTADDFDYAVSGDPFVAFDNVDSFAGWLPDKLALSAAASDVIKRKLYTDSDLVVLKRQALVGLTAHNPKFRREDIVDRMLMFNFRRIEKWEFKSETDIINKILRERDDLWGALIQDTQKVLASPEPMPDEVPSFRISDFAKIGLWAAKALGFEADFRAAVTTNIGEQKQFNLEEEQVLIDAISDWLTKMPKAANKFWGTGELFNQLEMATGDEQAFRKLYTNAVNLGKKLWALQDTLTGVFAVEYQMGERGSREWKFGNK